MSLVSVPCRAMGASSVPQGTHQTRVWLLDYLTLFIYINHSLLHMLSLSVALKLYLNLHDAQYSDCC